MSKKPIKVTFFGDSTCVGQGVSIYQGWVTKLAKFLDAYSLQINREIIVSNSSINGRTTRQALEDMPYHIQGSHTDILLIQFGLNDCNHWATDNGLSRVSLPAFIANIEEIISRAKASGVSSVLLNNNHPTSRDKLNMQGTLITYQKSNENYNSSLNNLAKKLPSFVKFQDIAGHFQALLNEGNYPVEHYLLEDGLHLSIPGHDEYYKIMLPVILESIKEYISAEEAPGID
jgi:lysophospholipase L1-like esterase